MDVRMRLCATWAIAFALMATSACRQLLTLGASVPSQTPSDNVETFSALAAGDHATEMYGPYRLAIDSKGDVWVMYINSNKVAELSPDGQLQGIHAVGGQHVAIAIDAQDAIWLLDGDAMVTKLDANATLQGRFAAGKDPEDLAIDHQGNVWVSNPGDDSLTDLSPDGVSIAHTILSNAPAQLAIDGAGNVWADAGTDHGDKNLIKVGPDGKEQAAYSLGYAPYAIVGDPGGGVWTSDQNGTIHRYDAGGDQLAANPVGGVIYGMACTPTGSLWLTRAGDQDEIIELSPKVTVVAKTFQTGHNPADIALDASGRVWFLNQLDGSVGRITLAPSPPPSIPPEAYNQLSFLIQGSKPGPAGFKTSIGQTLQLTAHFGYRSAPVTWRVADADRAVATVDSNGLLTPLAPGKADVTASVEGHDVAVRVAVIASQDVQPLTLPAGISGSAPSSGARVINDEATWEASLHGMFAPLPPPSPLPSAPIDFAHRSVLLLAYPMVVEANVGEGDPVVTHVATGTPAVVQVTYPHGGGYDVSTADASVGNLLVAFDIPKVPNDCRVEVANESFTGPASPLALGSP